MAMRTFKSGEIILLPDQYGNWHFAELQGHDESHGVWGIVYFSNYSEVAQIGEFYEIRDHDLLQSKTLHKDEADLFKVLFK